MICVNCQKENADGAKFCAGCGNTLIASGQVPNTSANISRLRKPAAGNRFGLPALAAIVLLVAFAWVVFFREDPLIGIYTLTNAEDAYLDTSYLFEKTPITKSETHTVTIKKANRFEMYDSFGGGAVNEIVKQNSGTYETKAGQIIFRWTDSASRMESGMDCTIVDNGFDCDNSIFKDYQYRKIK